MFDPTSEKPAGPVFNPLYYSPEQLDVIEAALRLLVNPPKQAEEVVEPDLDSRKQRSFNPR